jgi:hypothetical protein
MLSSVFILLVSLGPNVITLLYIKKNFVGTQKYMDSLKVDKPELFFKEYLKLEMGFSST